MYKIENVGKNVLYVKALGMFPISVAHEFVKDFAEAISEMDKFSVIVDGLDLLFVKIESLNIVIDLLKKDNEKLIRAAYVFDKNPPLTAEIQYILDEAESDKRKIVKSFDEAKEWVGISDIVIKRDD